MIKLPKTLSFRLTLWYASAFLVCLVVAFMGLYLSMNSILNSRMDEDLREDITEFQELFMEEGLEKVIREIEREFNSSDEGEIFFAVVADELIDHVAEKLHQHFGNALQFAWHKRDAVGDHKPKTSKHDSHANPHRYDGFIDRQVNAHQL